MLTRNHVAPAAVLSVLLAVSAHAQFVGGITKPVFGSNPPEVFLFTPGQPDQFLLNPENAPQVMSSAPGFSGLAADEANQRLLAGTTNGTTTGIYSIDYATLTPTFLTTTLRDDGGNGPVMDGLAYDSARGVLYGTRQLGGSTGAEGLYTIDIASGATQLVFEYEPVGSSAFQIGGIDYDAMTDRIYLADDDATGGRNIYSIDAANPALGLNLEFAYPAGVTDVDGVGAGDGKLFLLSDGVEGNGGQHRIVDIATGNVLDTLASPFPAYSDSPLGKINPSGAGAFAPSIPEPSTLALFSLVLLGVRRR